MQAQVNAFFFIMYNQKSEVIFSLAGLVTKIPQALLEIGVVYLIATHKKKVNFES